MFYMSRCNECNINFSKYQNFVAHKKYYFSATKQAAATVSGHKDDERESKITGQVKKYIKWKPLALTMNFMK